MASLKQIFLVGFLLLIVLSIAVTAMRPDTRLHGRTPIVWLSDDNPARRGQIDLFNRLNPQYRLQLDPSQVDSAQKIIVQSIAGVGPDCFCCYDGFQLSMYAKSGIAMDVTDELAAARIDYTNDVWPATHPTFIYEGRAYGFPANVSVDAIWCHKDLFEACGVPMPSGPMTWEEFLPLAKKMTVAEPGGRVRHYGLLFDFAGCFLQFVYQWGGRFYSEDGTRCVIDSPEAVAAMEFMHSLIYEHRVTPSPVEEAAMSTQGGWGAGNITWFGAKRGAMAIGGRWWLCSLRSYNGLKLGAFECPHGKKRVFRGYGKSVIVNRNSPNRLAAVEFLKYLAGQEYNELINHQADALSAVKKFCHTDKYLHDPAFPAEDFNAVWRDVMQYGIPDQICPFVNGQTALRILTRQLDLVKANEKRPADALAAVARGINEEIRKTLRMDPTLKARYEQLTGGKLR